MTFSFALLHLSALMLIVLFLFTLRVKRKSQLYYVVQAMLGAGIITSVGHILAWYAFINSGQVVMPLVKFLYLGTCFMPVLLYLTGLLFKKSSVRLSWSHILLLLPAAISYLALLTNEINGGLFYRHFTLINIDAVFGPIFYLHIFFSYVFIFLGAFHLLTFSIRNSGLFSQQSALILIAVICPLVINIITSLRVTVLPVYSTAIGFTITAVLFYFSIAKFQFLNVTPVATQTILDRMTDGFVVINDDHEIVHYNRAFLENFKVFNPKLMSNLFTTLNSQEGYRDFAALLLNHVESVKALGKSKSFEQELTLEGHDRYFQIDVTPIFISDSQIIWGKLVFFKDTTQIHKAIETINRNQAMLMEQQHLASLGQLIGGIAHNLRTPIMSISGGLESLRDLTQEYQISIGDQTVTKDDHREIAAEMLSSINKTKPYCSYMSEVISAVKDQAVRLSDSSMSKFTVSEFLKRVEILMKFELKRHHCLLKIDNLMPPDAEILGTMNNMIQIVGNIITNAIDAYEDDQGQIDLKVEPCVATPQNIRISIRDYGPGIPESVQTMIFKEMATTKGKNGTGLGLYLSYVTIKGKFGGSIWFDTVPGQGTTFYISVPMLKMTS